jgi:lipopolysaccharide export system protein LptA
VSRTVLRFLMFMAMVATGLTIVMVLSDPFERNTAPVIEQINPGEESEGVIEVVDSEDQAPTKVSFDKPFQFDVLQAYEVSPGVFEDRIAYQVDMKSGRPDPDGAFLAEGPIVKLYDLASGREGVYGNIEGVLRADHARFETDSSVGGSITLDFSSFHANDFSLTGNVQGEMPMADGVIAEVEADRIDVHGELVTAPGFVKWTREDMVLTGIDMHWDGTTGRLDFASDAHLMLAETVDEAGRKFDAPGGLTWTVPPGAEDPRTAGHGELRGRVTGEASDGTRLAADALTLDTRASNIRLLGASVFEREDASGQARLSAQHIELQRDDTGELALAEADGDVRLVSTPFAMLPAWMVADRLVVEGHNATSPDATWNQEGLLASGADMDWQGQVGRIDYARDAELRIEEGNGHPYEGLIVVAPGGMSWTVPPEATDPVAQGFGEMRGRVAGQLPDGTVFGADMLFFDGPSRSFHLEGSSVFEQSTDESVSQLEAQRITVTGDSNGEIAVVSAEGDVIFVTGPVDVMPTRLISERLDRMGDVISSPGVVTWEHEGLTVVGTGMRWNESTRRLNFDKDAQITFVDPAQRLEMELEASGGLTWKMPADALNMMTEGQGELRGRVTGVTSDGAHLETDTLLVDGPSSTFTLIGDSTISMPGTDEVPFSLSGDRLLVENVDTMPRVSSDEHVSWIRGDLTGEGTGLIWDNESGHLHLDRDVQLDMPADASGQAWSIAADGTFDWTIPPGSTDPFADGGGEVRGGVRGTNPGLGSFQTELLRVDSNARSVTMLGPSRYERRSTGEEMVVSAHNSIVVHTDTKDTPMNLAADGAADAWIRTFGSTVMTHLSGDRLDVDRTTGVFNLVGNSRIEQPSEKEGEEPLVLTATDHILVRTNDAEEITWVEAMGGVVIDSVYQARADQLTWDIAADLAELSGNCRLFAAGAWMSADRIELRPEAETFRIIRSVLRVDG